MKEEKLIIDSNNIYYLEIKKFISKSKNIYLKVNAIENRIEIYKNHESIPGLSVIENFSCVNYRLNHYYEYAVKLINNHFKSKK